MHALQLFQCIVRRILLKLGIRQGKKRRKKKTIYSPSVSVFVSVSLVSSPASPSVSLSSSLESSTTGFFLMRRGGAEPPRPPDLRAFTWPASESDCNILSAYAFTHTGQRQLNLSREMRWRKGEGGRVRYLHPVRLSRHLRSSSLPGCCLLLARRRPGWSPYRCSCRR